MSIYISTNAYSVHELENIFSLLDIINDRDVGIEIFPEWQNKQFIKLIEKNLQKLKKYKISLHGPYYCTEHSKEKGSMEYEISKEYFIRTLSLSKELNSSYIVYHHNNSKVEESNREKMIINSTKNLLDLNGIGKRYGANIVVENAGVLSHTNMLFNEEQFIAMAKGIENNILIDIGHAFANNWDLNRLIYEIKDKIVAYHLHNNNGTEDNHNRIKDGKLDIEQFFEAYYRFTPNADLVLEYNKECGKDEDGIIEDIRNIKKLLMI